MYKTANRNWLLLLLAVTLVFRLWTTMMLHTGIDGRDYWYSAKSISSDSSYVQVNHRTIRWGVILPTAAAQLLTGTGPNAYYVMPLLNALAQTALVFAIGLALFNLRTASLASLALIFFPYQIRSASQILPEIFSITYILALTAAFIAYLRAERGKTRFLALAGALMYVAYATKITNLFFMPGFFALILLYGGERRIRDCLAFGGIPLVLFVAETLVYGLAGYPGGQLAIIAANHLGGMETMDSYLDVFKRYAEPYLQLYWQIPFALFGALAAHVLIRNRERRLMYLVVPALSFFFFITFTISGLHPLKAAEPFINRYFSSALPFVFIVIMHYAGRAGSRLFATLSVERQKSAEKAMEAFGRLSFPVVAAGTVLFAVIFSLPVIPAKIAEYIVSPISPDHAFRLNAEYERAINEAYESGIPIVAAKGIGGRNAIETASWDYIRRDNYPGTTPPAVASTVARALPEDRELYALNPETLSVTHDTVLAVARNPFRVKLIPWEQMANLGPDSFTDASEGEGEE